MIAILSPAKNMRTLEGSHSVSVPDWMEETQKIVDCMRNYAPWELEGLLKVNPSIALKAFSNYQALSLSTSGSPALLSYQGMVYQSMAPWDFSRDELQYANRHVRILSAVYGLLRPLDGIHPHRLEMQCKLPVDGHANLYQFWGDKLGRALSQQDSVILNLASEEYARVVRRHLTPNTQLIDVTFLSRYKGAYKVLPVWAKMARGQMVRYLVQNRLTAPEQIQSFAQDGYRFSSRLSYQNQYVFLRD